MNGKMKAHRFGKDPFGVWIRDCNNLPCYELSTAAIPWYMPSLQHVVSTGRLILLGNQYGQFRLFSTTEGAFSCLSSADRSCGNALGLAVVDSQTGADIAFNTPHSEILMQWGIGYFRMRRKLKLTQDVEVELAVAAVPDSSLLVSELQCHNLSDTAAEIKLQVFSTFTPHPDVSFDLNPSVFVRENAAFLTDIHPALGDLFLAGDSGWNAEAMQRMFKLELELKLEAGAVDTRRIVLGANKDCTIDWLQQQLAEHSVENAVLSWAEKIDDERIRSPELWMQEECLWHRGRLSALVATDCNCDRQYLLPGGSDFFRNESRENSGAPGISVRDILTAAIAATCWNPKLAQQTLVKVAEQQRIAGRFPEKLGEIPSAEFVAERDRTDLELWFLVAWRQLLHETSDEALLDTVVPFADGTTATIWVHLQAAYNWIRDEIRQGTHDLLRIGAGDWSGWLDCVGPEGKGESVLNTALACYALPQLIEVARRRDQSLFADEVNAWYQELRLAVGEAFDTSWFRRGYTDEGRGVGSSTEDRLFTDVQAWCTLARCGTATQREQALQATLAVQKVQPAPAVLSKSYTLIPPWDVSSRYVPAGEAENGGVSLPVAAWLVWALAQEGHKDLALQQWQLLSARRRAAEAQDIPVAWLLNCSSVTSSLAPTRTGQINLQDMQNDRYPEIHAAAWYEFALSKILQ